MIKNRLVLIDSFALIYRAFYGIPMNLTHEGQHINAVYGFASAILSAIRELEPEYLVACFDLPKLTKRHADFVEYKAHRKPMPDDLRGQISYCKKVLEAMNIPIMSAEGYEGEDIAATIVSKVSLNPKPSNLNPVETIESIIVTGDSDTFQLINAQTRVYSMARGASHAVMYSENTVKERYGLYPADFVDFKALKGDTSDNIPGVPGIGEKTASTIIQKYHALDSLYEKIGVELEEQGIISIETQNSEIKIPDENMKKIAKNLEISEKVLKLLITYKDQAYLSRKLSQIASDAPIEFNLAHSKIHDFEKDNVEKIFSELGFKSLIARIPHSTRSNNQQALF